MPMPSRPAPQVSNHVPQGWVSYTLYFETCDVENIDFRQFSPKYTCLSTASQSFALGYLKFQNV